MRHADFPAPADVVDAHLEKLVPATPAAALGARVLRVATNPHLTGAPGCAVFTTIIIYIMAICLCIIYMAICLDLLQGPTGTCQQEQPAATMRCKPRNIACYKIAGAGAITLRTAQVPIIHKYLLQYHCCLLCIFYITHAL